MALMDADVAEALRELRAAEQHVRRVMGDTIAGRQVLSALRHLEAVKRREEREAAE